MLTCCQWVGYLDIWTFFRIGEKSQVPNFLVMLKSALPERHYWSMFGTPGIWSHGCLQKYAGIPDSIALRTSFWPHVNDGPKCVRLVQIFDVPVLLYELPYLISPWFRRGMQGGVFFSIFSFTNEWGMLWLRHPPQDIREVFRGSCPFPKKGRRHA